MGPVLFLVEDGPEAQVVFADAEAVFDLCEADVGFPQCLGVLGLEVGAQQIASVGKFGPFAMGRILDDGDGEALAALVAGVVLLVDVYLEETGGAGSSSTSFSPTNCCMRRRAALFPEKRRWAIWDNDSIR